MSSARQAAKTRDALYWLCTAVVRHALRPIATLSIPPGRFEPDPARGLIIVANHRSMLDIFVGFVAFSQWGLRPYMFVRPDYCRMPILGACLRALGAVPADRGPASVSRASELLRSGCAFAITPEGRIPKPEERIGGVAPLKPGVARLAAVVEPPILLVGMINTDACWSLGRQFPRLRLRRRDRPVVTIDTEFLSIPRGMSEQAITDRVHWELCAVLSKLESAG